MLDIKNNLDKRICDCEENADNTETYLEYIINASKLIGLPLNENQILTIRNATNVELNELLEELDYLIMK